MADDRSGTVKLTDRHCSVSKSLEDDYKSYHNADSDIRRMLMDLRGDFLRIREQGKYLKKIWHILDGEHQTWYISALAVLDSDMKAVHARITTLLPRDYMGRWDKVKFVKHKVSLQSIVDRVASLVRRVDPQYFTIGQVTMVTSDGRLALNVDHGSGAEASSARKDLNWLHDLHERMKNATRLAGSIPATVLRSNPKELPLSTLSHANLADGDGLVIIDSRATLGENVKQVEEDVYAFAGALRDADPRLGLLNCRGVIERSDSFDLVFDAPPKMAEPRSLRDLLFSTAEAGKRLDERLHIARLLARSMMTIHAADYVHKNVSPSSAIILNNVDTGTQAPFLLGFEFFRRTSADTNRRGDDKLWRNLYRHPQRQGYIEDRFIKQHDIYSLGVCLIEIGLWKSFVLYDESGGPRLCPDLAKLELDEVKAPKLRAYKTKEGLINLAREALPKAIGPIYTNVVLSCLMCLDDGNGMFAGPDDFAGQDAARVGLGFAEKVPSITPNRLDSRMLTPI